MSELIINGKEHQYDDGSMPQTLALLLDELGIDQATVVAEVDGKIVERKMFSTQELENGQKIELIRFVGGG
ncbi:MAG: sulfur carrier protein ThiS [Sedimentisphaeraceae bacterium JB056]